QQWMDVHGLSAAATVTEIVDGYPRQVWRDEAGEAAIESYTITGMAHGTPLATGEDDAQGGAAGAFLLDVGISSSYHVAKFFGLTAEKRTVAAKPRQAASIVPSAPRGVEPRAIEEDVALTQFDQARRTHMLPIDIE